MRGPGRLDVEARRRILDIVQRYPGLHLRDIQRHLAKSAALAEYHLNVLEKWGVIASVEVGGYRRFFPAAARTRSFSPEEKSILGLLRQAIPLGIVLVLLERKRGTHGEIAEALEVGKSTLTYHLKRLADSRLVTRDPPDTGREFVLSDRERVVDILRSYSPTPDLIEAYSDMWADIFGAFGRERGGDP